jgi:hypothetical protein
MRGEYIDLEPPRAQVKAGRLALTDRMELVPVEADVFGVAERLKRIDPGLKLSFNKKEEVFVLEWHGLNDKAELVEEFVGAYTELDGRLVNLVERLAARENRNRYELAKELDRLDAERDREHAHEQYEKVGPIAEGLAHALRKDLGIKNRAYMSNGKKKRKR